jgi:hypothetical protein
MSEPTFEDRMFLASEAVYQQIVNGSVPGGDVEAALMQAHADASSDQDGDR